MAPLTLPRDIVPSAVTLKLSLPLFKLAAMNVPGEAAEPPRTHGRPRREISN